MSEGKAPPPEGPRDTTRRPFRVHLKRLYELRLDELGLALRLRQLARRLKGVRQEPLPQAPPPGPPAVG